ncbi:hypothetical protein [Burkholderia gladioli]|uniref:hypothetical protein n=1 Tax=Burkholderia gladioli TaxID=28095 RepID=UPI000CFF3B5F|nr:hypothetical protein [Burkholderia gladioli]PRE81326.1 hypothetical protein C6Q13_25060 [Burkholderia gladioli]
MRYTPIEPINATRTTSKDLSWDTGATLSWTISNVGLDQAAEDNLPIVNRMIDDLFRGLGDSGAPPRKQMAGRFKTVAKHIGAGSRCCITFDMVLRASATTWAYKATFSSGCIEFAELEISGVL